MKGNHIGNHAGESATSRADKMSGWIQRLRRPGQLGYKKLKTFYNKKRRQFLKNPLFFDKI